MTEAIPLPAFIFGFPSGEDIHRESQGGSSEYRQ